MAYFDCIVGGSGKGNTLVVTCADELAGATITCTNGTKTYTKTCPSTSPYEVTFYGLMAGTWTVSATVSGNTYTTTVVVVDCAALLGGFNWRGWVDTARFLDSTDYNSLDEVLADELAVRELCLEHACVDYLADITTANEDIETIINTDLFAKWVNNSDYSLDVLGANTAIKALMDTADKYGYGEWALMPQVPTMTSNTTPYGEAFSTATHSSGPAYYAFANDASISYAGTTNGASAGEYVGYHHIKPVSVKKATASFFAYRGYHSTIALQGSHDNSTWNDISEEVEISSPPASSGSVINDIDFTITDFDAYEYHRIIRKANRPYTTGGDYDFFYVSIFKMYDWAPKGNVPVMTSNTAPYGEVSASSVLSTNYAYKAFDGNSTTGWHATAGMPAWISYKFTNPICVRKVVLTTTTVGGPKVSKIQGSNDGSNWTDITDFVDCPALQTKYSKEFNNTTYYLYLRLYVTESNYIYNNTQYVNIMELQFYGRELWKQENSQYVPDYSEKEFEEGTTKKWLYDHGVELEEIVNAKDDGWSASTNYSFGEDIIKESSDIIVSNSAANKFTAAVTKTAIDLTEYSYACAKCSAPYLRANSGMLVIYSAKSQNNNSAAVLLAKGNTASYLDISTINQASYVACIANNGNNDAIVKELWLE